jgi:xylan 1,4-beta-xylosidase
LTVRLDGVTGTLRTWRVDAGHHDISRWRGGDWPDDEQWLALAAADRLDEAEPARDFTGEATLDLPNPGIAFLEIQPRG